MEGSRRRRYRFIINFEDGEVTQLLPEEFPEWVTFATWQLECGEKSHIMHYQGYLELSAVKSMVQVHAIPGFERAGLKECDASRKKNIEYANKEQTRIEGPWTFGEAKEQGKRSDLLAVKEDIDAGMSVVGLWENHFSSMTRYSRAFEEYKLAKQLDVKRTWKTKVLFIVGPPGMQKSTLAYILVPYLGERVFTVPDTKGSGLYYDGYTGQDVVVLDEMDGHRMAPTMFNGLADEHAYSVPIHGRGNINWAPKVMIVISNYLPKYWWRKRTPYQIQQTTRRIDFWWHRLRPTPPQAPERPDVVVAPVVLVDRRPVKRFKSFAEKVFSK